MEKEKKKGKIKKILLITLGVVLSVILVASIAIFIIAKRNVSVMEESLNSAMTELKKHYSITEIDPGEYKDLTLYGIMNFDVNQYYIEELGNLSVMSVDIGVMQMSTFVITPIDKNMPLVSIDYMYMLDNRICYVEFYDLVEEKDEKYNALMKDLKDVSDKYKHLENAEVSEAWYAYLQTIGIYKNGGSQNDSEYKSLFVDVLNTYFTYAKDMPQLTHEQKRVKLDMTVEYTHNLVDKGGISTDVFKGALGPDETKKFFDKTFFGTDRMK